LKLSSRAEYGVRAMLYLALHYSEEPIPLKLIAERESISFQYLEQIFPLLRKSGLIESVRGTRGGYRLASPPGDLTAGDVIRALEGPIAPVRCLRGERHNTASCPHGDDCVTRNLWEMLRDNLVSFLDSISLWDMVCWSQRGDMKSLKEV